MASRGHKRKRSDCVCESVLSGTEPAVFCENCSKWYHFRCIAVKLDQAEDMVSFICPACRTVTGRATEMFWDTVPRDPLHFIHEQQTDSSESNEDVDSSKSYPMNSFHEDEAGIQEGSEDEMSSGDDYNDTAAEDAGHYMGGSQRISPKRRVTRRMDKFHEERRHRALLNAPTGENSHSREGNAPHVFRAVRWGRAASVSDDPVRKYCYGKLLQVILPMFEEHYHRQSAVVHDVAPSTRPLEQRAELSEPLPHNSSANGASNAFVDELESCLYEDLAEFDEKKGVKLAGAKYRERFRMLTFNLAQKDRTSLRRQIGSGELPARELARMTSADLANEERQHEIELARRESLQHSILEASMAPTAKMTHKGEEIIETSAFEPRRTEDVHAASPPVPDRITLPDDSSEKVEEHADRSAPTLASPQLIRHRESLVTSRDISLMARRPSNLDIQVSGGEQADMSSPKVSKWQGKRTPSPTPEDHSLVTPVTPSHTNFSLNAVWSAGNDVSALHSPTTKARLRAEIFMEDLHDGIIDPLEDESLDALLAPEEQGSAPRESESKTPDLSEAAPPIVWHGQIVMPMDPLPPLFCNIIARQVGGPKLGNALSTWALLFTSPVIRIDGRVPVPSSTQYLLNMRMTANKELIAVALSPYEPSDQSSFAQLFEYLYTRGRHGIVFPWGVRPPDAAIGKDLYIVPLKAEEPIPEYIQLLDHLQLPIQRSRDLLIACFVLHKARVPHPQLAVSECLPSLLVNNDALKSGPAVPASGTSEPPPMFHGDMSPPSVNTVAQDIANLTPEQLLLIQSLIEHAGLQAPASGAPSTPPVLPPVEGALLSVSHVRGGDFSPLSQQFVPSTAQTYSTSTPYSPVVSDWHKGVTTWPAESRTDQEAHFERDRDESYRLPGRRDSRKGRPFDKPRDSGWGARGRSRAP